MPTEVNVYDREKYIKDLKELLPRDEVDEIVNSYDEKIIRYRHPRNRLSRRIHQLARWIEKYP